MADQRLLRIDLLVRRKIPLRKRLVARKVALDVGHVGFVLRLFARSLVQHRLIRPRIDLASSVPGFTTWPSWSRHLHEGAIHPGADGHRL